MFICLLVFAGKCINRWHQLIASTFAFEAFVENGGGRGVKPGGSFVCFVAMFVNRITWLSFSIRRSTILALSSLNVPLLLSSFVDWAFPQFSLSFRIQFSPQFTLAISARAPAFPFLCRFASACSLLNENSVHIVRPGLVSLAACAPVPLRVSIWAPLWILIFPSIFPSILRSIFPSIFHPLSCHRAVVFVL